MSSDEVPASPHKAPLWRTWRCACTQRPTLRDTRALRLFTQERCNGKSGIDGRKCEIVDPLHCFTGEIEVW